MRLPIIALALLLLSGCGSGMRVFFDYDKSADFASPRTFAFTPWNNNYDRTVNQITKTRILDGITAEMNSRGMARVEDPYQADLLVNVYIALEQRTAITAYTDFVNHGMGGFHNPGFGRPGWGGAGFGTATTRYRENVYVEGTMVLDIVNRTQERLIWQGVAVKTLDPKLKPRQREKAIRKGIERIFKEYPKRKVKMRKS
jgi:hypothetical protein